MWPSSRNLCGSYAALEPLRQAHETGLSEVLRAPSFFPEGATVPTRDQLTGDLSYLLERRADGLAAHYCLQTPDGRTLGLIGFSEIDRAHKRVEIAEAWLIRHPDARRIYTEAMVMLITQALELDGCVAVEFRALATDAAHRARIEALGAQLDGVLRARRLRKGAGPQDIAVYSLLAAEWPALRDRLSQSLARPD